MNICGLQKTTLLDYPGHVAATIFLGGCSFRCPFCHNSDILAADTVPLYTKEEILAFLKKRHGVLEGVCITGGEPALSPDLESFIREIRELGLLVKLDTNGYHPDVLKSLAGKQLLDYAAMDIKAGRANYSRVSGVPHTDLRKIEESADFLLSGSLPYEFRTTAVKGLHTAEDFCDISRWIRGCSRYYLQNYTDSEEVLCPGFQPFEKNELLEFAEILKTSINQVFLRGIDC